MGLINHNVWVQVWKPGYRPEVIIKGIEIIQLWYYAFSKNWILLSTLISKILCRYGLATLSKIHELNLYGTFYNCVIFTLMKFNINQKALYITVQRVMLLYPWFGPGLSSTSPDLMSSIPTSIIICRKTRGSISLRREPKVLDECVMVLQDTLSIWKDQRNII